MERRTQAERRDATRKLLVDAAIASLVERGWSATTAVEVCRRAGVTRGALVHHFPSLPALLAAALEAVYREVPDPPPPVTTLVELVELTWDRLRAPEVKAVIEAWLAAANDPELRGELTPVIAGFAKVVGPDELPWPELLADDERAGFYLTAREAMLGLALGRAVSQGRPLPHEELVLDRLRAEAENLDGAR